MARGLYAGRWLTDSCGMWVRHYRLVCARMPSTRSQGLNPRLQAEPVAPPKPDARPAPNADAEGAEREDEADAEARAGGFHESSYELHHGLQVSESDWPEDVTVPTPLGKR